MAKVAVWQSETSIGTSLFLSVNSLYKAKDHSGQGGPPTASILSSVCNTAACHLTPFGADEVRSDTSLSLTDALDVYLTT